MFKKITVGMLFTLLWANIAFAKKNRLGSDLENRIKLTK